MVYSPEAQNPTWVSHMGRQGLQHLSRELQLPGVHSGKRLPQKQGWDLIQALPRGHREHQSSAVYL